MRKSRGELGRAGQVGTHNKIQTLLSPTYQPMLGQQHLKLDFTTEI